MKNSVLNLLVIAILGLGLISCEKNEDLVTPQVEEKEKVDERESSLKSYSANYYPSSAVSYALAWTNNSGLLYDTSPNNDDVYRSYNPNDCANFVSQCLLAGGLYTDNVWKCNYQSWSPDAWIQAQALHSYLVGSAYSINTQILTYPSSVTSYINSIYTGDLVFYFDYKLDVYGNQIGRFDHVTIVTSKTATDALVSGHSANQQNHSLRTYLQSEKSDPNDYVVVLHFN